MIKLNKHWSICHTSYFILLNYVNFDNEHPNQAYCAAFVNLQSDPNFLVQQHTDGRFIDPKYLQLFKLYCASKINEINLNR